MEISLPGARSMDPEYLDGDRSDESIDYLDINEQDAGLVDSDDAEEEIDDSAQDGSVLGGRSDWGTDPRPAVEIDEEAEGDYAVGDESGVQRGGGSHRRPGPRPAVHIDEDLFRSHCTRAGPDKLTDSQLSLVFGCTLARVKRLKVLLGLTGLGKVAASELPDYRVLLSLWVDEHRQDPLHRMAVRDAVRQLAHELGVNEAQLRQHMREVGFEPKHPWKLEEVESRVREIMLSPWCSKVGAKFMATQLRIKYQMVVRESLVRTALRKVDPTGVRNRQPRKSARPKGTYNVGGPRSLYHLDAHEKLAKIWGIHCDRVSP